MKYIKEISICLGLLPIIGQAAKNKEVKRPNILFIMSDDHAVQAISAYGHSLSKLALTPNIDRLAKQGVLFTAIIVVIRSVVPVVRRY